MLPEVRKALDQVEDVLLMGGAEGHQLWDVLTALRGPDNGDWELKGTTTIQIRRAAFPRVAADTDRYMRNEQPQTIAPAAFGDHGPAKRMIVTNGWGDHFERHVNNAYEALDINPVVGYDDDDDIF